MNHRRLYRINVSGDEIRELHYNICQTDCFLEGMKMGSVAGTSSWTLDLEPSLQYWSRVKLLRILEIDWKSEIEVGNPKG